LTRGEAGEGSAPTLTLPDKPSIAVLPFQNMSGDPEQEYFADGMVEEIITALSRIRWLFVIARNSSFTYKGQAVDVKQVGRELGVRYVLEGSVRKGGNRVRITAQLIEAETGAHLWADRFDGLMEEVFELQDTVATSVAGVIEPALRAAETRRSQGRPTNDLTAYDLYLRSFDLVCIWEKAPALQALAFLEQAVERDPRYGLALALAAFCHSQIVWSGWADDAEASRHKGIELARRALQVAGDDPVVLANAAGALANFGEDIEPLLGLIDRSLALNPGSAFGWFWSGWIRVFAGHSDQAIEHFATALRLDPRTQLRVFHLTGTGIAHFEARRLEEAASALFAALQLLPSYVTTYYFLASCYAHMGRLDEAHEVARRLRDVTSLVIPSGTFLHNPEQREFFLSGLRLAAGEMS
jgi:adenylate cyclase